MTCYFFNDSFIIFAIYFFNINDDIFFHTFKKDRIQVTECYHIVLVDLFK